ncbi:MAG: methyltransferase domain-containing protein [Alphaproteobacteria bacterium]|nr:methyltransferase domain-containing protein [Alphaproteobacteria bacterium]
MNLRDVFDRLADRLRPQARGGAPALPRQCPICGFRGTFSPAGQPSRPDARCPRCRSRERHRLIHLFLEQRGVDLADGRSILHFAPEKYFVEKFGALASYDTADIAPGKAKHTLDVQKIDLPEASYDVVIANHVLEHAPDDRAALREIARILKPDGFALLTVPQNWSRDETYENKSVSTRAERFAHYADHLHVRYYGRDFPDRIREAGLEVEAFRLPPDEEVRYALNRGDVLYIATKAV